MLLFINIGLIICTLGAAVSGLGGETWDKDKKHLPLPYRFTPRGWLLLLFLVLVAVLGFSKELQTRAENKRKDGEATLRQKDLEDRLADTQKRLGDEYLEVQEVLAQEATIQNKSDKVQNTLDVTRDKLEKANTTNLITSLVGSQSLVKEVWLITPTEKVLKSEEDFDNVLQAELSTPTCSLMGTKVAPYFRLPPEALVTDSRDYFPSLFQVFEETTEKDAIIQTSSMKGPWKDLMNYLGPSPYKAAYVVKITPRGEEKFSASSLISQIQVLDDIFGYYLDDNHPHCMETIKPHSIQHLRYGLLFLVLDRARNETIMIDMRAQKTEVYDNQDHKKILRVGFKSFGQPVLTPLQFAMYTDEVSRLLDEQPSSELVVH
jgi:hypothetical protein